MATARGKMMENSDRFIRLRKKNRNHDRGIIAVDAICAAFENQEEHKTEIATLDGFWYDVEDSIEEIYNKLLACEVEVVEAPNGNPVNAARETKKSEIVKRKKIASPAINDSAFPRSRDDEVVKNKVTSKVRWYSRPPRPKKSKMLPAIPFPQEDLPSSEGEGRHDPTPRSEHIPPQIGL